MKAEYGKKYNSFHLSTKEAIISLQATCTGSLLPYRLHYITLPTNLGVKRNQKLLLSNTRVWCAEAESKHNVWFLYCIFKCLKSAFKK